MNNPYRMALLLTLGMLPVAVFYQALSCLIQVKQKWRHRFLLATGSFLLIFMVIFTGDSVNFTCAILFFLFCMWVACKGTRLKRVTIGLMLASTILALNGLYDSCITSLPYFGLGWMTCGIFCFVLLLPCFCICASAITSRNATLN